MLITISPHQHKDISVTETVVIVVLMIRIFFYLKWSSYPGWMWQVPPLEQGKLMQALIGISQFWPCRRDEDKAKLKGWIIKKAPKIQRSFYSANTDTNAIKSLVPWETFSSWKQWIHTFKQYFLRCSVTMTLMWIVSFRFQINWGDTQLVHHYTSLELQIPLVGLIMTQMAGMILLWHSN